MLTMEMFVVLIKETAIILTSSAAVTALIVFLITGGPRLSMIVTFSIILTNYFLLAMVPLANLTLNNVVVVYLITSMGLSVLYSAQISHTFLTVRVDSRLEPKKQRNIKARIAMSRMASSVFHSAIVTLIAIIILSIGHKSYYFEVFTKLWLGIIVFGLLNAFFFAPVVLSLIGPTPNNERKDKQRLEGILQNLSSMNESQLKAFSQQFDMALDLRNPRSGRIGVLQKSPRNRKSHISDLVYPINL